MHERNMDARIRAAVSAARLPDPPASLVSAVAGIPAADAGRAHRSRWGVGGPRWLARVAILVGAAAGALVLGFVIAGGPRPTTVGPSAAPSLASPSSSPGVSASPATAVEGSFALPAISASQLAQPCLRDTGTWVLRGSASGPWLTWADGGSGPEMELLWPAGYRARFVPLLEVLAPDGAVVAREGAPIRSACEIEARLVYPDELIPPNVAPAPVGLAPGATMTPVAQFPAGAVEALEPGFAIFGAASAGKVGLSADNTGGSMVITDAPGGASRTVAAIPKGHGAYLVTLSANWVAWVETWFGPGPTSMVGNARMTAAAFYTVPGCVDFGRPLDWRIMAAPRAGGPATVVSHGTNVRGGGECDWIAEPALALQGDRIAWTTEAASAGHPDASRLTIHSLATGADVRELTFDGSIGGISLDGQALLYIAEPPDGSPVQVLFAADDAHSPAVLPGATSGGIGGGRIAWQTHAGDGSVWIGSEAAVASAVRVAAPVEPGSTWQRADSLSVDGEIVAWIASGALGDGASGSGASRIAIWRSGWPSARPVSGYAAPEDLQLADGWLGWHSGLGWMDGAPDGWYRVPLSALP